MDYASGKENLNSEDGIQFMRFVSKSPVWDSRRQTFTINFYGKVRQPSSKNFQCDKVVLENFDSLEGEEDPTYVGVLRRWWVVVGGGGRRAGQR